MVSQLPWLSSEAATKLVLKDLKPLTKYKIEVAATSDLGTGVLVQAFATTYDDGKVVCSISFFI